MLERTRTRRELLQRRDGATHKRAVPGGADKRGGLKGKPLALPADTRARILQTAEALFAEHGFDAVSMRDITTTARVNLASVNYHFGSKIALLSEVVGSRANELVEARLKLLAELPRDRQRRPRLEAVIAAFLRPSLEMSRQPGGANHMRLRARLAVERVGVSKSQFEHIFDQSNEKFVDALAEALPALPRAEIYWGFHCILGIQNYTMANSGRIQHLSRGACDPSEVEATLARIVPFIADGFRALRKR
ncbi:MAG TPA: TetR/AcrR family transcriptional regulator [Xanthobacteraceae bacterium]|nr:TetR/AcrR family transcriptional regulator [Xanthobacteraceae bacterium]